MSHSHEDVPMTVPHLHLGMDRLDLSEPAGDLRIQDLKGVGAVGRRVTVELIAPSSRQSRRLTPERSRGTMREHMRSL